MLYLSIESTQEPRLALDPLLKTLGLVDAPQLLSLFYRDDRHVTCASSDTVFYCASACDPLPAQACDDALRAAEVTFRRIVGDSPIEMFPTTSVASDD